MIKTDKILLALFLAITLCCSKDKLDEIYIESINVYMFEDLDTGNKPVCLKINISSVERFDNEYLLNEDVSIYNNNILIDIDEFENLGRCEYPEHLSLPKPYNYQCPASTNYFSLDNLARGLYTIEIQVLENTYNGQFNLFDQYATLHFNENNVGIHDSVMLIVPDSCFFGTYYSINFDSAGFQDMIDRLLSENCRKFDIKPGLYRSFEVDTSGILYINPGQIKPEPTFLLKYSSNMDEIVNVLNDFIAESSNAYGIIFEDHLGNYYSISKDNLP
jgi:hypothetical protein